MNKFTGLTNSQQHGISCAELRISMNQLVFNNQTASELGYPYFVNLLVGKRAECLIIIPAEEKDDFSIPFYTDELLHTKPGRSKQQGCIEICESILARCIRMERGWSDKRTKKVRGIWYKYRTSLFFDLTKAEESNQEIYNKLQCSQLQNNGLGVFE